MRWLGAFDAAGRGAGLAAAALVAVALSPAAQAARCDYSGFEQPCRVAGGEYRVLIPEGEGPFPALVYLYGSGGRAITIATHPVFETAVGARGYALIVPSALELTYAGGIRDTGWSLRHEPRPVRDETAFVRAVIEDAARRFRLDRGRILLAGQSRGGFLATEIACHEPGLATAYAVHGAGYLGPLPERCAAPVRFLHTHGRADALVPLTGRALGGGFAIAPMFTTLDLIARTNGCGKDPGAAEAWLGFRRQGWSGCARGSRLDLMLHDGGHAMPSTWFRAVLDWFEEPLPEPAESRPVVRRIGEGLPGREAEAPASSRFKVPPAPGEKALTAE
jgi:polyhydroxybutyrate depolymerase